ncbi:MAG: NADH-quinone oxidoreductase subunit J [Ktedonobacteraceae bacterium]
MNGIIEWVIFIALAAVTVGTAAGMILTMSMYRAGLALMASFVALAGLFILLDADLMAAIQIMMNVGGMLVMVLFMVMMMMDPGGEMMWGMKRDMHMPGPGAFSMHMPRGKPPEDEPVKEKTVSANDMSMSDGEMDMADHDMNMSDMTMTPRQNYQMMVDMAMSTAQLPWAIALGIASALLLIVLLVQTPWPLAQGGPTQDATTAVGELLLSRYMIGFEGAAFLILAGIAGAVLFAKRERGDTPQRGEQQAAQETVEASTSDKTGVEPEIYTCPMHPEIHQTQPGSCPKCGMQLLPIEEKVPSHKQSQHQQGGHS